jgi:hypothetical protein
MEVGILPAYPRRIAASGAKVLCVTLQLQARIEALVVLVIGAAKMLIPDMVVGQSMMYPQMMMSLRPGLSCEHWRGNSGGKNSYHAQRFHDGHWLSPPGETALTLTASGVGLSRGERCDN